jgi:hypothetical protein
MGADKLRQKFPALIEAVEQAGQVRHMGQLGTNALGLSLVAELSGGCLQQLIEAPGYAGGWATGRAGGRLMLMACCGVLCRL